jgi:thiosulfate/3-mercaptopyruvate sulfurtransferase
MHTLISLCFTLTLLTGFSAHAEILRIDPERVHSELGQNPYQLIDARSAADFEQGHIPGAINLPASLTFTDQGKQSRLVSPTRMQALLQERGLDIGMPVVIYDGGKLISSARIFWVLEVYGFKSIRIMSPSFEYWRDKGFPVSLEPTLVQPSDYVPNIDHQRLANRFQTLLATRHKAKVIIDARDQSDCEGKTSSARRFGHIASAINIPASHHLTKEGGIKSIEQLKALYADVPKDSQVIAYCNIGLASTSTYFAMRELGIDVANYDASWGEWGNDDSLPIETGKP